MAKVKSESSSLDAQSVVIYQNKSGNNYSIYPVNDENPLINIDSPHEEIHEGNSFTCNYKADIVNGANLDLILITPNNDNLLHLVYELDVESETDINIYEDAVTGTGSSITIYNRNRNSAVTSSAICQYTPGNPTTGTTAIRSFHLGSGRATGGSERATHEFILKKNTKYLFRLTNATTLNNYMAIKLDWYLHST